MAFAHFVAQPHLPLTRKYTTLSRSITEIFRYHAYADMMMPLIRDGSLSGLSKERASDMSAIALMTELYDAICFMPTPGPVATPPVGSSAPDATFRRRSHFS